MISKAPPPKAPSAYWQDLKAGDTTETREGEDSHGSDSKGKEHKGKDAKGKDAKGKDADGKDTNVEETEGDGGKWINSKGGETLPTVDENTGAAESIYPPHTTKDQNWGTRNAATSMPTRIGSIKTNGHIRMETGGKP